MELSLPVLLCALPVAFIVGGGVVLGLLKLGVIGSYWLKGDTVEPGGTYTLNQSKDVADDE